MNDDDDDFDDGKMMMTMMMMIIVMILRIRICKTNIFHVFLCAELGNILPQQNDIGAKSVDMMLTAKSLAGIDHMKQNLSTIFFFIHKLNIPKLIEMQICE